MSFFNLSDIVFPNLGLTIHNLPVGIDVFGFKIAFYGITIGIAMLVGYFVAERQAKKYGQSVDNLMDFALVVIIAAVVGARAYYVIFHWDSFKDDLLSIFNLRTGGLAIYGGVIVAIITAIVFCRVKKIKFGGFADICIPGLLIGQVIGRWANFFNREAFGGYTDNLFAMRMDLNEVSYEYRLSESALRQLFADKPAALERILDQIRHNVTIDGVTYVQTHPTFLYESLWNLGVFIFVLIYAKRKKFDGEILCWYAVLYGIGRFWIEGLRTDQLFLWNSAIPVSQAVAVVMVVAGLAIIVVNHVKCRKNRKVSKKVKTSKVNKA